MEVIILLIYKSSLYILDRSLLSICKISLSFSVLSFHFPDGITDNTKVLNCDETQFTYIFLGGALVFLGLYLRNHYLTQHHKNILSFF